MNTKSVGRKLKTYRIREGWSQEECAEKIGISAKYLSYIETGSKVPQLATFIRILNVLHASADDVLQDSLVVGYQAKSNAVSRELDTLDVTYRNLALDILQFAITSIKKSL